MNAISKLTVEQLKKAIGIKEEIGRLQRELGSLAGTSAAGKGSPLPRRKMSAAGRAKIAADARKRWAAKRAGDAQASPKKKKRRRVSAALKRKLSTMAKERWKKAKAAGKTKL